MTPPTITADSTDNTLANDITLTFTDDAAWRADITNITVDGEDCETLSYESASGQIVIQWRNFERAKTTTIVIEATGYDDASVSQVVKIARWSNLVFFETTNTATYPISNDDLSEHEAFFGDIESQVDRIHNIVRRFVGHEIRKYWNEWEETIRKGEDNDSFNCLNYIKNPRILKETMIYYALYRMMDQQAQDPEDMYAIKANRYKKDYGAERDTILKQLEFESPVTDYEEFRPIRIRR